MIQGVPQGEILSILFGFEIRKYVSTASGEEDFSRIAGVLPVKSLIEQRAEIDARITGHRLGSPMGDRVSRRLHFLCEGGRVQTVVLVIKRCDQFQIVGQSA